MNNQWNNMRRACRQAALIVFSISLSQGAFSMEGLDGDFARGSKSWSENCARCHNMRSPSELRDDQWVTSVFHMRVRAGLTGQETRDILAFLQASNGKIVNNTSPVQNVAVISAGASGEQIYQNNCTACHGVNGKGNIPGVPDFSDKNGRLTKSDNELLNNVINGLQSTGSLMAMPPKGGNANLTETEIRSALDYIRALIAGKTHE